MLSISHANCPKIIKQKKKKKSLTLCSFLYRPHALQTGKPSPFLRHSVVVYVEQLEQVMPVFLTVVKRRLFGLISGRLWPFIL